MKMEQLPGRGPTSFSVPASMRVRLPILTAGCGSIDLCTPCICERSNTPTEEGYARIMLRGSTALKNAVRDLAFSEVHPLFTQVRGIGILRSTR